MAWLEQDRSNGPYQLVFRFGGQRLKRSTRTRVLGEAEEIARRVERRSRLVEAGDLEIPTDCDPIDFLMGKSDPQPRVQRVRSVPQLHACCRQFLDSYPDGAIERNSRLTITIHLNHLQRVLGASVRINEWTTDFLQHYVNYRSENEKVARETINKEISTASSLWRFAQRHGWVNGSNPTAELKYPKTKEKPHFRTFHEIEQLVATGQFTKDEERELWDALILTREEIELLLDDVAASAGHGFILPMIATAAYTGLRRSELVRAELQDLDLDRGYLTIREKKRNQCSETTRRVPLSKRLHVILQKWLTTHPGGRSLFFMDGRLRRSRAGYDGIRALSVHQAHDHLKRTLRKKWSHIKGWHVFRHSFASNCAASGVDQRVINEWMGHQTEEMVRRYRHLLPDQQRRSIELVYG